MNYSESGLEQAPPIGISMTAKAIHLNSIISNLEENLLGHMETLLQTVSVETYKEYEEKYKNSPQKEQTKPEDLLGDYDEIIRRLTRYETRCNFLVYNLREKICS